MTKKAQPGSDNEPVTDAQKQAYDNVLIAARRKTSGLSHSTVLNTCASPTTTGRGKMRGGYIHIERGR